jgi:hypothetical protein
MPDPELLFLLPITGFALYPDGSILIQRGTRELQLLPCRPDLLSADDFKSLLWVVEAALGARHNELQQTEPGSIQSMLRVIALCHASKPTDPAKAILTWLPLQLSALDVQSFGRSFCESVAGFVPRPSVSPRAHASSVAAMGGVSETNGAAAA